MTTSTLAPTLRTHLRWARVVMTILALEVVMVATAVAWVAFYSYVIRPGGDAASYEAYAKVASPIVSVVAGVPVFYAAGRWLAGSAGVRAVLVMVAAYIAIDLLLVGICATDQLGYVWLMSAASHATKLAAAYVGVRRAMTSRVP